IPKALSAFDSATQNDPSNLEAFSKLAVLYHSQGRLDDAKQKYERLVQLSNRPVVALTFLGNIAQAQNKTDDARKLVQRALKLDPNFSGADDAKKTLATIKS